MYALDFEYDGQLLSSYGFIICSFDGGSSGVDVVSAGSKITFNKVSRNRGRIFGLSGTKYDECVSATFEICKNTDLFDDLHIADDEYRSVVRWLNRREFLPFRVVDEDDDRSPRYYDASFNIDKIVVNKELVGLKLTMETNRPFGYGKTVTASWSVTSSTKSHTLSDTSDEIGYIYPLVVITCNAAGDLSIYNEMTDCTTVVKGCSAGEVITFDGATQIIQSSLDSHQSLHNDFNFEFPSIGNSVSSRSNKITISLPCSVVLQYAPIIKDTPE